jgi:hypothetical protein
VSPRRDVEGEIYAQLYGEPPEASDPAATRVIGDEPDEPRAPQDPDWPPPHRPSWFEAAVAATAARMAGVKTAVHSARTRAAPAGRLTEGRRGLAIGAVAAAVIALGVVAGLSVGSGDEPARGPGVAAGPPPSGQSAQAVASEAREARRRRAVRRAARRRAARRADRRRAAQRPEASRAEAAEAAETPATPSETELLCVEGQGCAPRGTVVRPRARDDDADERPAERDKVDEPSARRDLNVDSGDDDPEDLDVFE